MSSELTASGQWFYVREGRTLGPVNGDELRRLFDSGELDPTDVLIPERGGRVRAGDVLVRAPSRGDSPSTDCAAPRWEGGTLLPLPELPGYEVLGEIGHGGMGVVYKARQVALGRVVALKTLLPSVGSDPGGLDRFSREARALARLQHPGIVQIYEVGEHAGRPFFAMEYLPAGNLAQRLAGQPQPAAEAARIVESLARAVEAAHAAGIVHRDLKPGNVLLAADGALKVTDFGLVKDLAEREKMTQTGAVVGTVEYMAPEQAQGDPSRIGPPTDVYALGVILYEALVGFTPFHGPVMAVLHAVLERDPDPPSRLRPGVPRDLELICLKCLEKDPRRRYATAADLADELARFRKGEPVRVRPLGPAGRAWRWCLRNPAVAALLALVGLMLASGTGVASYFAVAAADAAKRAEETAERERQEKVNAQTQQRRAEREEDQAQRLLYANQTPLAWRLWQEGNVTQARLTLAATRAELRAWEFGYLDWVFNGSQKTIRAHDGGAWGGASSVAFSPDGALLASSGQDGTVRVWDARTGVQRFALPPSNSLRRVLFSPDGKALVTSGSGSQGGVTLRDPWTGRELRRLVGGDGKIFGACFTRDGKRLAGWLPDKTARVWDVDSGRELHVLKGHKEFISSVDLSPDGRWLASASGDRAIFIWDLTTGKQVHALTGHGAFVYEVSFSRDGKRLLSAGNDGTARVWDAATGRDGVVFRGHRDSVECACFSPDDRLVASSGSDDLIRVWDSRTGRQLLALRGHEDRILCVAYSPDGKRIASAGQDGTVKLWDAARGQEPLTLEGRDSFLGVAVSPNGRHILTACWDGAARLWDAATGAERLALTGHRDGLYAARFSTDGKLIATAGRDKTPRVWDAGSGKELFVLKGHTQEAVAVCFDRAGSRLATAGEDGTVRVWDARIGKPLKRLQRPAPEQGPKSRQAEPFASVCFSPDGTRVVAASCGVPSKGPTSSQAGQAKEGRRGGDWLSMSSQDTLVRVWDADTGEQVLALAGHTSQVHSVCYSPNGEHIASASSDRTVKLWDAATGREVRTLRGHSRPVLCVCFSEDGKRIASAGMDRTVKVWDAWTGQELLTIKAHDEDILGVCFSPDGRRLLTASDDGTVKVWGGDPLEAAAPRR